MESQGAPLSAYAKRQQASKMMEMQTSNSRCSDLGEYRLPLSFNDTVPLGIFPGARGKSACMHACLAVYVKI